jgi:uncharacterized repeat protein (TIGR01451 family)
MHTIPTLPPWGEETLAMVQRLRRWLLVLLAAGLAGAGGCSGVGQGPYLPSVLSDDGLFQSHASPAGLDPHACRLDVAPVEATIPVRTQHVLVATVCDENGQPRPRRRVEWMLEGAGNIIEVDESGATQDRGQKHDNRYAVSYTSDVERRISRNNGNPADDFVLRPGQTWCVVSSAVEGDSHVTVYAPEIPNWDNHKVIATKHWVDADWVFPRPAANRTGTRPALTTSIFKHTDRQPLAGYHVRYRILDGPPAVFLPDQKQEVDVAADSSGSAAVSLAQVAPEVGGNRIGVEVLRPPDRSSGSFIVIGRGETTAEWQAPQVTLTQTGPPTAALGQEVPYTIVVGNTGKVDSEFLTVHDVIPQGLRYVRSEPKAEAQGNELIWPLGKLPGGESRSLRIVFQPTQPGKVVHTAAVVSHDGLKDEKKAETEVVVPGLAVVLNGPSAGTVGAAVTYDITVSNTGTGPATNVQLLDNFDEGLEHELKRNPLGLPIGTLDRQATKTVHITLTPRRAGQLANQVTALADGVQPVTARHTLAVQEAKLALKQAGPHARYVGRPVEWKLTVGNPGPVAVANVVVRDQLPAEVVFQGASDGGVCDNGQVTWNLGALQAGERRTVTVTARCGKLSPRAVNRATASADPGLSARDEAGLEIRGLPAFRFEVSDRDDPVELNEKTGYKIEVTNQGSLPGSEVQVTAQVPPQMRVLSAKGPTAPKNEGQTVTFAPVDALPPGQTLTYTIEVQAIQAGEVRFRAELRAATLSSPVVQEESTTVFALPPAAGRAPAPTTPASPPARPGPTPGLTEPPPPMPPPAAAPAAAPAPANPPPAAPPAGPPAPLVGPTPPNTPPPAAPPAPVVAPEQASPSPAGPPAPTVAPMPASPPPAPAPALPAPAAPSGPPSVPAPAPAGPPLPTPLADPPPLPSPGGAAAPPPPLPVPAGTGTKPPK